MARVTYRIDGDAMSVAQSSLPAPKDASNLFGWFRAARTAIPRIPNPMDGEWIISHSVADISAIVFEMHNQSTGQRSKVFIDRKSNAIGF
jgi:hypothetical protein